MSSATSSSLLPILAALVAAPLASAASPQQVSPRNTGLQRTSHYSWLSEPGPGRSFVVSEQAQGGVDLNGDGDTLDRVLHLLPPTSGPVINVGLAADEFGPHLAGNTVALAVSEKAQGGIDLNGDGNTVDNVVHLVDATTGAVTNLGLAVKGDYLRLSESHLAINAANHPQGPTGLHVLDLATGVLTNYGLAATEMEILGGVVAAFVAEWGQSQDLNGDGDQNDIVLHVVDAVQGVVHNVGTSGVASGISGPVALSATHVAYREYESAVGADLNGDGDLEDSVEHLLDIATGGKLNTGLATTMPSWLDGDHFVVAVSEEHQGADLNQDGDEEDRVVFVRHVPTGAVTNTKLAVTAISGLHGRRLTMHVSESAQGGQDLNGDGDVFEDVLHVMDVVTGDVTNVGLQVAKSFPTGRMIGFLTWEGIQGPQDLNGDGDMTDLVWHAYDARTGTLTGMGVAATNGTALRIVEDDFLVCVASEFKSGQQDLNGDGDLDDEVVFLLRAGGEPQNLGVALSPSNLDKSIASSGRRVLLPVQEASQGGTDLNGDGDTADQVVHVVDVP